VTFGSRTSVLGSTPTTVKALFRCTVKGCRFAARTDVAAERQTCRTRYSWMNDRGSYEHSDSAEWTRTVTARGWYQLADVQCPDHGGRKVKADVVEGKQNDDVKCNAACLNARRASCECQCAGANHGGSWDL
jgi:hypothetical protein